MLGKTFRHNLEAAIKASPLTQTAICDRAGYARCYVRRVIIGAKPNPTLLFVESMAGALGVSAIDLLLPKEANDA